ncbi:MAG: hypothetical protein BWY57_02152 [Betaproteobacteria bacterium ADurb.Bin341]|nr:MAG: hypothetical protein BWY57_02152 [Betaproteobacteria bacterium ADurb.Bin341]
MGIPRRLANWQRFLLSLITLSSTLILSGCLHIPVADYQQPADAQAARLIVRSKVEPETTYTIYMFANSLECRGLQRLGSGGYNSQPPRFNIVPSKQTSLEIIFRKPANRYCRMIISFNPETNRNYLLQLDSRPDSCWTGLFNASNPDDIIPEPSATYRDALCNVISKPQGNIAPSPEDIPEPKSGHGNSDPKLFNKPFDDDLKGLINKDSK